MNWINHSISTTPDVANSVVPQQHFRKKTSHATSCRPWNLSYLEKRGWWKFMATNNTSATIGGCNSNIFCIFTPTYLRKRNPIWLANMFQLSGLVQPPTRQQRFLPGIGTQQKSTGPNHPHPTRMIRGLGVYGASPNLVGAPKVLLLIEETPVTPAMSETMSGYTTNLKLARFLPSIAVWRLNKIQRLQGHAGRHIGSQNGGTVLYFLELHSKM